MAQPYEVEALAVDLKVFATHLIGIQTVGEFWDQLDDWNVHIQQLIEAQEYATKAQQDLLSKEANRIAQEEAERARAAFGLGMMALSLVTGPLVSFIAGKIEHVWFPKYAPSVRERVFQMKSPYAPKGKEWWGQRTVRETHYDEVKAKVFGDGGGQVAGLGINGIISVASPNFKAAEPAIALARESDNMKDFKSNVRAAFVEQAKATRKAIRGLAGAIANNPNWGFECLAKLSKKHQGRVTPEQSDKGTLQNLSYQMIREDVDRVRQQWADDWFFYGQNPPTLPIRDLREALEIEQWALWILNEDLGIEEEPSRPGRSGPKSHKKQHYLTGYTFGDRPVPEGVLRRLADFGVFEARTIAQEQAGQVREAEKQRRRMADPPPFTTSVQEFNEWENRQRAEDQEERMERPLIKIGDRLDTKQEFEALEKWARDHPPKLSKGQLASTKRKPPPIEDILQSGKYTLDSVGDK